MRLHSCAFFAYLRTIYNRALWQTFQDLRSSLSVSQPLRSVGTPPPSFLLLGCDVASVVPRQLATAAPALGLRLGTRRLFPPQCTCSLRCARAPLGGVQGLFYQKETIQRPRTNANGTSRNLTEPHAIKWKSETRKPYIIGVFNLHSRDFFYVTPFRWKY